MEAGIDRPFLLLGPPRCREVAGRMKRDLADLRSPDSREYLLYSINRQCEYGGFLRSFST